MVGQREAFIYCDFSALGQLVQWWASVKPLFTINFSALGELVQWWASVKPLFTICREEEMG